MPIDLILKIVISLLPAVMMLLAFMFMDSYKLMDIKSVLIAIGMKNATLRVQTPIL